MKNIIAISGSNSSSSINTKLINYTAQLAGVEVKVLDLTQFDIPIFSEDIEKEVGAPGAVKELAHILIEADGVIVSTPEHNGMPTAFFKNILDWLSRASKQFLDGKQYLEDTPLLLMSAGPGKGGAAKARALVANMLRHAGANQVAEYQLDSFYSNFEDGEIKNEEKLAELKEQLEQFLEAIKD